MRLRRGHPTMVIDELEDLHHKHLSSLGGKIIRKPEKGAWAQGYYSILLQDPDGMRFEVNYVPGQGLLAMDNPQVGGDRMSSNL
eukprot:m.81675 g.81675  ORF g.81675 m.81675 type:complete len:84 (-) comp25441_c2_seq1:92-343(-)